MSRLVDQRIRPPALSGEQAPHRFIWAGQTYRVEQVLDCWRDIGAWWEGEAEKIFWRVQVWDGGVFELWQDAGGNWAVYRVWD